MALIGVSPRLRTSDIIFKPGDRVQWGEHGNTGTVIKLEPNAYPVWVLWDAAHIKVGELHSVDPLSDSEVEYLVRLLPEPHPDHLDAAKYLRKAS